MAKSTISRKLKTTAAHGWDVIDGEMVAVTYHHPGACKTVDGAQRYIRREHPRFVADSITVETHTYTMAVADFIANATADFQED